MKFYILFLQYLKMSDFTPINISNNVEKIIKKTKKVKSKLLTKKVKLIIEDEEKTFFLFFYRKFVSFFFPVGVI